MLGLAQVSKLNGDIVSEDIEIESGLVSSERQWPVLSMSYD